MPGRKSRVTRRRPGRRSVQLPADLTGPVEVALAKPVEQFPGPHALPGGTVWEPKWDGYRATLIRADGAARLWSRQGKDFSEQFADVIAAAAAALPEGCVLDGELVAMVDGRLSFDALQRRLVAGRATARRVAAELPASYAAFDLLAVAGVDLRPLPWTKRRQRLESLTSWAGALQLTPVTRDVDEAKEWFEVLPEAIGVEGLVAKGANSRYAPGRREWLKVKWRDTVEVIVGGVIGSIDRPEVVIAGRFRAGELVQVGRTVPLSTAQAAELAAVLKPTTAEHPWPDEIATGRWGGKNTKVPLTRVAPTVVAEVSADAALQTGAWRHPLRYIRHRPDLHPDDLDELN